MCRLTAHRTTYRQLNLQDRRHELKVELEIQLNDIVSDEKSKFLSMTPTKIEAFAEKWRADLTSGTMEKRKAVFRQVIESAEFDGEALKIVPSYRSIAGVNMASPRGFEPLLPP